MFFRKKEKPDIFKEMALSVIKKLDQKINSEFYQTRLSLQIETDTHKVQSMADMVNDDDIYSRWFLDEVSIITKEIDITKIHLMSAIIGYLAFLNQFRCSREINRLRPFEIFYKVYLSSLELKGLNPVIKLGQNKF